MSNIIATYHKDCIDGTTAAAVVLRKFPDARVFPLAHSYTKEDMAPILAAVNEDTICFTVDCALGVAELLEQGCAVTTIDHHIGAKDTLEALAKENPRFTFIFDTNKSGASLAWTYFFPDEAVPEMIRYVEDADLWKGEFGEVTKYVNSFLSLHRNDPVTMLSCISGDLSDIIEKGTVLTTYADKEIESQVAMSPLTILINGHSIPAYNITVYQSACGNILSERHGGAVALYTIKGDMVKCSFRSKTGHTPDALTLATALGGGGHYNAAGASVPLETFLSLLSFIPDDTHNAV